MWFNFFSVAHFHSHLTFTPNTGSQAPSRYTFQTHESYGNKEMNSRNMIIANKIYNEWRNRKRKKVI